MTALMNKYMFLARNYHFKRFVRKETSIHQTSSYSTGDDKSTQVREPISRISPNFVSLGIPFSEKRKNYLPVEDYLTRNFCKYD